LNETCGSFLVNHINLYNKQRNTFYFAVVQKIMTGRAESDAG